MSWPVVVEAGKRFSLLRAVNVSGRWAKVRPTERLGEGSVAQLHFHRQTIASTSSDDPSNGTDDHRRRLAPLLAPVAGAPPALGASTLN